MFYALNKFYFIMYIDYSELSEMVFFTKYCQVPYTELYHYVDRFTL